MTVRLKLRYWIVATFTAVIFLALINYDVKQTQSLIDSLTLFHYKYSLNSSVDVWPNKKWPKLELLLPVAPTDEGIDELGKYFLPSFSLFWPILESNTSLLIITDKEKVDKNEEIVVRIHGKIRNVKSRPKVNVTYRIALNIKPDSLDKVDGHSRQQWLMLWAENYTTADYVGFVDTDTVFVTRVTLSDLFDEIGRPIVRPLYGKPLPFWDVVPQSTFKATGKKSPFFCMTYFPVIVKVAHLALLREHIRRHMNTTTFDEAFFNISRKPYSQFDLICDYLWYNQRDSYHWAIGQRDPNWLGPIPEGQVESLEEAEINTEHLARYGPLLAIHWNYPAMAFDMQTITQTGICYALQNGDKRRPEKKCAALLNQQNREDAFNPYEWTFEWAVLSYDANNSLSAHRRRLDIVDKIPVDWQQNEVEAFFQN